MFSARAAFPQTLLREGAANTTEPFAMSLVTAVQRGNAPGVQRDAGAVHYRPCILQSLGLSPKVLLESPGPCPSCFLVGSPGTPILCMDTALFPQEETKRGAEPLRPPRPCAGSSPGQAGCPRLRLAPGKCWERAREEGVLHQGSAP